MPARASFTFDEGIATSSWNATFAFRMRVSMSARGSVIVTARLPPASPAPCRSPRRLRHAGDLACVCHLSEADAAQPELAVHGARAPASMTARIRPRLELRWPLLLLDQCLLRHVAPRPCSRSRVATEREAERLEERATLLVPC